MDLQSIGEFHCDVCFDLFGESLKCPRMLTCGHSFCHACLENLLAQSPSCPNCKRGIQFANVDSIPVNYIVKSLVSRHNVGLPMQASDREQASVLSPSTSKELTDELSDILTLKEETSSKEPPNEGYCEEHQWYKHFRCMDCNCWICGNCATLIHRTCRILLVAEAFKEMKQEKSREVEAEIEAQKRRNDTLDISLKDLEAKRAILKEEIKKLQLDLRSKIETLKSFDKTMEQLQLLKSESKKHCEEVKTLETLVISSTNEEQFMKATSKLNDFLEQSRRLMEDLTIQSLTIEAVRGWCQVGSVYASHCENGTNLFGQVKLVGNRVWVHCFKSQSPRFQDKIVSFDELLTTFNGSSELPKRGFIQVEDEKLGLKDVVIATDSLTPRAMNFLFLCSGIRGRSYEGVELKRYGSFIATPPYLGGAVVEGITDGGVYEAPQKKGFVYGEWVKDTDSLSGFAIRMKDDPSLKLDTKFGFVEEGLDFCDGIYKKGSRVLIKQCGLVI